MPELPFSPVISSLSREHDRGGFTCGARELDIYLQQQASQDQKRSVATCYVLHRSGSAEVLGYYTLSSHAVLLGELPETVARKLPRYPHVPATLLGRLAVHSAWRGHQLGTFLLMDALHRAWVQSQQIASMAVVVDALDDSADRFYRHHGFTPIGSANRLFLPMKQIAQLFDPYS